MDESEIWRDADFVTKFSSYCHEIARWKKNNPSYGKKRINELQRALEEVQTNDNTAQDEIVDVSMKLKDEEEY